MKNRLFSNAILPLALTGLLAAASSLNAQTLAGSLLLQATPSPSVDQQSYANLDSRTTIGATNTRGAVTGSVDIAGGHTPGADSYSGVDVSNFSALTNFNHLNRFGSDSLGGVITWDFDLSTYLSGKTIGNSAGNSQFSLDVDYTGKRSSSGQTDYFYISYTGGGLTLDTTDVTTLAGDDAALTNLVETTANYQKVMTLAANTAAGTLSVDLTAQFAALAAGANPGIVRVAFISHEFQGGIILNNQTGIVETIAVPEPAAAAALIGIGSLSLVFLRRRRR